MAAKNPAITGDSSNSSVRTVTAGEQFTAEDTQRPWINVNAATAQTMVVNGAIQRAEADVLEVRQAGAGAVSLAVTGGATLNAVASTITTTAGVGQRVRITCITPTPGAQVWEYL